MITRLSTPWIRAGIISLLLGIATGLWIVPPLSRANEDALFFETTGHTLTNEYGFLNHWRNSNGQQMLGAPVTEMLVEDGLPVQYFERGRLESHIDLEGAPIMHGRLGVEYAEALWRTFDAPSPDISMTDGYMFAETDYTLREPFLTFWETHGGIATFGFPISEPLWEHVGNNMLLVQYFERGRLEHRPLAQGSASEIQISTLGRDLALLRGLATAPVANPNAVIAPAAPTEVTQPAESEAAAPAAEPEAAAPVEPVDQPAAAPAAQPAAAPAPAAQPAAAPAPAAQPAAAPAPVSTTAYGGKYIVVNLSAQWLYAYEGDILVYDAPISTGKDGFNTPAGNFAVYAKIPSQTMSGNLGGEYYNVPNVPDVMYINGGVAIHGTYWHNMFGTGVRVSHGCINLPLGSAEWLYNWAPLGTSVQVTY